MGVELEFYLYEELTGVKTKIDNQALNLGNLFKGTTKKIPIAIKNIGDAVAVAPSASIAEFFQNGKNYSEAIKWKKLSLDKNVDFNTSVLLPDIAPNSWMSGKDIYFEDFSQYSTAAGTKPDMSWFLWAGNEYVWEIYNNWLQHNVDSQPSRALWGTLPSVSDFEVSLKITVRNGVYAGWILRDTGDYDTGYIVLVQGQAQYFDESIPQAHGVIQVWRGKFSSGLNTCTLLYQSGTIGVRGTHDYFKIKLKGNRFDFWYNNQLSDPLYSFIDTQNTYAGASKPVLCSHAGSGSILVYFDEIKMEVDNNNGLLWIDNSISLSTPAFGEQYSILKLEYGGV